MSTTTQVSIYLAIFAVCAFACVLAIKLYLENQGKVASEQSTAALSAEKNIGDGI